MDNGSQLHLCVDSPAFVKDKVCEAVRRWRWRSIEERLPSLDSGGLGAGAAIQPIFRLLDPRADGGEDWGPRERAGLRSALANHQWPQARLFRAGLASTRECQLCLAVARTAHAAAGEAVDTLDLEQIPSGTLAHRIWSCGVTEPQRRRLAPPELRREARDLLATGPLDSALWLRALVPLPVQAVPAPPGEETFVWVQRPSEGAFCGVADTDGSLLDGPSRHCGLCCRLGWAFVVVDNSGSTIAAAHGVPPPWVTTIHGAELWGLQMAAQLALPGTSFRIDCLSVVQVYNAGRKAATSASRYYARIWNVIFSCFDDAAEVDIAWMPAHTKADDVGRLLLSNGQPLTCIDRQTNAEADRLAKAVATSSRVPASVRGRIDRAIARACQLAKWIGQATALASKFLLPGGRYGRDSAPGPRRPTASGPGPTAPPVLQRPVTADGHHLERTGNKWHCLVCCSTSSEWSVLAPARCPGPAVDKWARRAHEDAIARGGCEHRMRALGSLVWCDGCGAYATKAAKGLARACGGRPANRTAAGRLRSLRAGLHPVTGESLIHVSPQAQVPATPVQESLSASATVGATRWNALLARVRAREAASAAPASHG